MKMVKSLLLGTAAGLVAMTGAQAADLPVKAKPVQYVKICSLYGAGFYYIPGTDTCIKIGGFVRAEVNFNAGGSFAVHDVRATSTATRTATYVALAFARRRDVRYPHADRVRHPAVVLHLATTTSTNSQSVAAAVLPTAVRRWQPRTVRVRAPYTRLWSNAAFIQFAGFTAGKTGSFFDFDLQPYSNQTNFWGSNLAGGGIDVFAYTAQFGNGMSASLAAEDPNGHSHCRSPTLQPLRRLLTPGSRVRSTAISRCRTSLATCASTRLGVRLRSWAPTISSRLNI